MALFKIKLGYNSRKYSDINYVSVFLPFFWEIL